MVATEFSVRWKDHSCTLASVCSNLLDDNFLVDCTLAAEGQCLKAHRLILSACSPYFQLLFSQHNEKHPIVHLKDTKFDELKAIIDFIYHGEVQISEDRLEAFLFIAESLQIKGLNNASKKYGSEKNEDRTSNISSEAPYPESFTPDANSDIANNGSPYYRKEAYGGDESAAKSKDGLENPCRYSHLPRSEVFANSVDCKPTIHLEDGHNSCYDVTKSSLMPQLQPSLVNEDSSSHLERMIKSEPVETILVEPKCEQMDDSLNEESVEDFSDNGSNDIQHMEEQTAPGPCKQNVMTHYSGVSSYVENSSLPAENAYMLPPMPGHLNSQGLWDLFADWTEQKPAFVCEVMAPAAASAAYRQQTGASVGGGACVATATPTTSPDRAPVSTEAEVDSKAGIRSAFVARTENSSSGGSSSSKKTLNCLHCSATFRLPWELERHSRQHAGEVPFACVVCHAAFNRRAYLSIHMRIHDGQRPFKCEHCRAAFTTETYLALHQRVHQ